MPIVKRLYAFGEGQLARLVGELLSNPAVGEAVATAFQKAFETKGKVDRNLQSLLGLLNLPSRADVNRLLTKLEAIQGSLVNLQLKVDRLLATRTPRTPAKGSARKAAKKTPPLERTGE